MRFILLNVLVVDFWNNDIALVYLEESVPSGPDYAAIQRIHLPSNGDAFLSTGDVCVMKGWGCTSAGIVARYSSENTINWGVPGGYLKLKMAATPDMCMG